MTEPYDELLDLAVPYALHAVRDDERDDLEDRLADAGRPATDAFYDEVRAVRETMAVVAAAAAAEPPTDLRTRLLSAIDDDNVRTLPQPTSRRRIAGLAAAAAVALGLGAVGVGLTLRPPAPQSTAQQVFSAPDVHTVSGAIPAGGTATVVFSRDRDAGVLVMNDVPPPSPGSVYQMWLVSGSGATSAGTMDDKAVSPSTTAVLTNLGKSTTLRFTLEPGSGSTQPTGQVIAELPLS